MAVTTVQTDRNIEASYANVKETFPESQAPVGGTISTGSRTDQIIGVGTSFTEELQRGDYIWDNTNDEIARVENVVSDTELRLSVELSNALAGATYRVVKKPGFKTISWLVDDVNTAKINTITYPLATSKSYGNGKSNTAGGGYRLSPIIIDTTVNGNTVYASGE